MKHTTAVVTSLVVASGVAFGAYKLGQRRAELVLDRSPSGATSNLGESNDDNSKLTEAVGKLDRRLAALELRQTYAKTADRQAPGALPGANAAPFDPEEMKEKELARAAAIDAALKTQPRDSAWASATENQLHAAVDAAVKEGAQFSSRAVKCLTSICEVVLYASNPDQLRHLGFELAPRIGEMNSVDIAAPEVAADGSATVTCRVFRKGYSRPDEGT